MNFCLHHFKRLTVGIGLSTLIALPSLAQTPQQSNVIEPKTQVVEFGNVRAELSYRFDAEESRFKDVRLRILREKQELLKQPLPLETEYDRPLVAEPYGVKEALQIKDLDGDGELEILVDAYTGGAHCCSYSLIYRYQSAENRYSHLQHFWGNVGYRFKDFNNDGIPEFDSADDRFAYQFASYAGSAFPLQIWQYRQGQMLDITRDYPQLVFRNAYRLWQDYLERRKLDYGEEKAPLAAYLATKYLLGQEQDGWQRVRRIYQKRDRKKYFIELKRFLRQTGYIQPN